MQDIILAAIERYLQKNTIIRHGEHGLTKQKFCLINFMSSDKVTHIEDEGNSEHTFSGL